MPLVGEVVSRLDSLACSERPEHGHSSSSNGYRKGGSPISSRQTTDPRVVSTRRSLDASANTELQKRLQLMHAKLPYYAVEQPPTSCFNSTGLGRKYRRFVVEWFIRAAHDYHYTRETIALATNFFDRYLAMDTTAAGATIDYNARLSMTQFVAFVALVVATKIEEQEPLSLSILGGMVPARTGAGAGGAATDAAQQQQPHVSSSSSSLPATGSAPPPPPPHAPLSSVTSLTSSTSSNRLATSASLLSSSSSAVAASSASASLSSSSCNASNWASEDLETRMEKAVQLEKDMLSLFRWRVAPPTSYEFVNHLVHICQKTLQQQAEEGISVEEVYSPTRCRNRPEAAGSGGGGGGGAYDDGQPHPPPPHQQRNRHTSSPAPPQVPWDRIILHAEDCVDMSFYEYDFVRMGSGVIGYASLLVALFAWKRSCRTRPMRQLASCCEREIVCLAEQNELPLGDVRYVMRCMLALTMPSLTDAALLQVDDQVMEEEEEASDDEEEGSDDGDEEEERGDDSSSSSGSNSSSEEEDAEEEESDVEEEEEADTVMEDTSAPLSSSPSSSSSFMSLHPQGATTTTTATTATITMQSSNETQVAQVAVQVGQVSAQAQAVHLEGGKADGNRGDCISPASVDAFPECPSLEDDDDEGCPPTRTHAPVPVKAVTRSSIIAGRFDVISSNGGGGDGGSSSPAPAPSSLPPYSHHHHGQHHQHYHHHRYNPLHDRPRRDSPHPFEDALCGKATASNSANATASAGACAGAANGAQDGAHHRVWGEQAISDGGGGGGGSDGGGGGGGGSGRLVLGSDLSMKMHKPCAAKPVAKRPLQQATAYTHTHAAASGSSVPSTTTAAAAVAVVGSRQIVEHGGSGKGVGKDRTADVSVCGGGDLPMMMTMEEEEKVGVLKSDGRGGEVVAATATVTSVSGGADLRAQWQRQQQQLQQQQDEQQQQLDQQRQVFKNALALSETSCFSNPFSSSTKPPPSSSSSSSVSSSTSTLAAVITTTTATVKPPMSAAGVARASSPTTLMSQSKSVFGMSGRAGTAPGGGGSSGGVGVGSKLSKPASSSLSRCRSLPTCVLSSLLSSAASSSSPASPSSSSSLELVRALKRAKQE